MVPPDDVLQVVLMTLEPVLGPPTGRDQGEPEGGYLGAVALSGAFSGEVAVWCSTELARRVASAYFARAEAEVGAQDLVDAVAELTNIVGGNLKALLPPPSDLHLPTVRPWEQGALPPQSLRLAFGDARLAVWVEGA